MHIHIGDLKTNFKKRINNKYIIVETLSDEQKQNNIQGKEKPIKKVNEIAYEV